MTLSALLGGKSATVNGYRIIDRTTGTVQFSISALRHGVVLQNGTITLPEVSATQTALTKTNTTICDGGTVKVTYAAAAALTLDSTGSMANTDPTGLRGVGARDFISRMRNQNDKAAIATFDTATGADPASFLAIKLWQGVTNDQTLLEAAIGQAVFSNPSGSTPLWDALYDAVDILDNANLKPSWSRVAVVLTDGADNASTSADVASAGQHAVDFNTRAYMIGLGGDLLTNENIVAMQDVATQTNGLYNAALDASDLDAIFTGLFNSFVGEFCIETTLDPVPKSKDIYSGQINFNLNGEPFTAEYRNVIF